MIFQPAIVSHWSIDTSVSLSDSVAKDSDMEESPDSVIEAIQETERTTVEQQVPDPKADCVKFLRILLKRVGKRLGRRKPLNIALVGPAGVGKSSFVNSLFAALSRDTWREVALSGSHGTEAKPITIRVAQLKRCGMELTPEYADEYKDDLLPTLVDLAGVENEHSALCKELLKIVFFGRLPEGEALIEAKKFGEKHGIQKLRDKYTKYNETLKIDRIIFFASATEQVPAQLIQCVLEAARPDGEDDNVREIPVFGYMTKIDRVTAGEVSQEDFLSRKNKFIQSLGLQGSTTRFIAHHNYCDDTDPDQKRLTSVIPEIDAPLLMFMTQVCDPVIRVINPDQTFESEVRRRKTKEAEQNRQNEHNKQQFPGEKTNTSFLIQMSILLIIIVLLCIGIYTFFSWLVSLSSKLESKTVNP